MGYDDNFILQINGEDMRVEGAYDQDLCFPFYDARDHAKYSDKTSRLYHIDAEGNRNLVAEYLPSGEILQTRFIFVSKEDKKVKTREFPDIYKALDYALDWTMNHRIPSSEPVGAHIMSGKPNHDGGYEWITSWEFDYPKEITISYTPGFGTWFFVEDVPNVSEDLIECLRARDEELAKHVGPENISLKWKGDCSEGWECDLFYDLDCYLNNQIVYLMKDYKFTMMEAVMFVLDNATDFDIDEIAAFVKHYLNVEVSDVLITRYLDDSYLKLKVQDIKLEEMYRYKQYNDIRTKNKISLR